MNKDKAKYKKKLQILNTASYSVLESIFCECGDGGDKFYDTLDTSKRIILKYRWQNGDYLDLRLPKATTSEWLSSLPDFLKTLQTDISAQDLAKYAAEHNLNAKTGSFLKIEDGTLLECACEVDRYLEVPDSVEIIANGAFRLCKTLTTLVLGKNVKTVRTRAFWGSQILKRIEVSPENTHFCAIDGVLYTHDKRTLKFFPSANCYEYTIGEGVRDIADYAFYKSLVREIHLPSTLRRIGFRALYQSFGLCNITSPHTDFELGDQAFFGTQIQDNP